ncbi:ABC transporter ATP-binding protein [Candidatus Omnitrophota bacterium]
MLIEAKNIHKVYKDGARKLEVLGGIDLSINRGEIVFIAGPSGAGKSTLLHIIGALDNPTKGQILFDNIDIYASSDNERSSIRSKRIGFIFQFYHLLSEFNALENILMPTLTGNGKKSSNAKERACQLLESVGLKDRLHHRPSQLSGGEMQRVAIARALINNPDIVFCDEPTGNLDSENSKIVLDLIKGLNKENKQTFLIVTHDEKLAAFGDRVIKIRDGLLV